MPVCKQLMSWGDVPRMTWAQEVPSYLHGAQTQFEPAGDLHGKAQGLRGLWAFWPCYKGCAWCAQEVHTDPGYSAHAPGWGTEPWTKKKGTKKGVSPTPRSQLSAGQSWTPPVTYFLHIRYVYRWWGLFPELSLWGLFMRIAGLGFFMFYLLPYDCRVRITLHLQLVFWGNIEECSHFWTGLLWNISQRAACQEEHRVLHSALLPMGICTFHWGRPARAFSFSLAALLEAEKSLFIPLLIYMQTG